MPRTPARVTQADIARVLRAVKQDESKWVIEIRPNGSILIIPWAAVAEEYAEGEVVEEVERL